MGAPSLFLVGLDRAVDEHNTQRRDRLHHCEKFTSEPSLKGNVSYNNCRQIEAVFDRGISAAAVPRKTNPGLVDGQQGWLGAEVAADAAADTVTVIARWKKPQSDPACTASEEIRSTVARFAKHSVTPSEVRVVEDSGAAA